MIRYATLTVGLCMGLCMGLALALPTAAQARGDCSEGWVCVETEERADGVTLYARNLKEWPVTLSLRARVRNLRRDGPTVLTRTLEGGDRMRLQTLDVEDPRRDWYYRYWYDWAVGRLDPEHDEAYRYRLPYAAGESYRILQGFGSRFSHTGRERYAVDFQMAQGTPVHAARGGTVVRVVEHNDRGCWEDHCGRYANFIVVLHSDGTTGEYYHLQQDGALVSEGERVRRGQHIAYSGNTGHTTVPHLHFAIYRADSWGRTQSLPLRFTSTEGEIRYPRAGRRYRAE